MDRLSEMAKNTGDLHDVNAEDADFIDTYVKPFSYSEYERFLKENILTDKN